MSKVKEYIGETVNEMVHNVTWPTWKELQANTIIVVVASIIFSLLIFVMDYVAGINGDGNSLWQGVLGFIYRMF